MKKLLATLALFLPLVSFANTTATLQLAYYRLDVNLSNQYDGPFKDEGVKGLAGENRNGIIQESGMFKSLDPNNQNKDAAGSVALVHSDNPLTTEKLINESLGWLLNNELTVTQCPNYQFQHFKPTCFIRQLRNEVRDVSFIVYSAISPDGYDAIVVVGLVGQPVSDGFDYRTIKSSSYGSANAIYYDLLQGIRLTLLPK